jgi:hypothetical protein
MAMNKAVNYWRPKGDGSAFELSPILTPLAAFKDYLTIVSGLSHRQAEAFSDGGGDHSRASASWLSGVHPKQAEGADVRAAMTVDQLAADLLGKDTQLPSLELSIDRDDLVGNCDNGYSCVYVNTLSWRTPTTPLPPENNPAVVFERLFGDGGTVAHRLAENRKDRSILDALTEDITGLQRALGPGDQQRVDEYLEAVREIERRIQKSEKETSQSTMTMPDRPVGIPPAFGDHVKLMFDLQWLAYQSDVTRVSTFMLGRELGGRSYPELGVPVNHHGLSHHRDDTDSLEKLSRINTYHVELFSHFVNRLGSTPEGDGTLLDHTVLLYGAGLSNPNEHSHLDLPLVLVGAPGGARRGHHLVNTKETPMMNLLVSVLNGVGVPIDKYGDSTGRLEIEPLSGI